MQLEPLKKP